MKHSKKYAQKRVYNPYVAEKTYSVTEEISFLPLPLCDNKKVIVDNTQLPNCSQGGVGWNSQLVLDQVGWGNGEISQEQIEVLGITFQVKHEQCAE